MYIEDPGKTLVHVPRGFLGLKNAPFGAVFKIEKGKYVCLSSGFP